MEGEIEMNTSDSKENQVRIGMNEHIHVVIRMSQMNMNDPLEMKTRINMKIYKNVLRSPLIETTTTLLYRVWKRCKSCSICKFLTFSSVHPQMFCVNVFINQRTV